jgi:hypothetical protein
LYFTLYFGHFDFVFFPMAKLRPLPQRRITPSIHLYPHTTDKFLMSEQSEDIHHPHFAPWSVESLLSVPLQFIFRETQSGERGGGNSHTSCLFSKSEVSTLLRVTMVNV